MGKSPKDAALKGAQEVWGAVLASTLTTLAVFVPVIFVQGQAGQLFRDIAIAISCAVGLSLIVSITVIPTAARRMLREHDESSQQGGSSGWGITGLFGLVRVFSWLTGRFAAITQTALSMRGSWLLRLGIVAGFVTGSLILSQSLMPDTEYLPKRLIAI